MARQFIYHMAGLSKTYGTKKVLEDVHLSFYPDAKIGILGPNGAGKSTVLRIMAGLDKEHTGEAWLADGATCGYLPQEPQLDESKTVVENVMEGVAEKKAILDRYNSQVEMAMEALRCPPSDSPVTDLSGGEKRRVALCKLLLSEPDLLLLDEPTNHLDAETIGWLEKHLREYAGSVLMITHDRYFLDNVTGWILELDRGRGIPYEGNYTAYLEAKAKRLKQEGREEASRQRAISAEAGWIASSPKARQAKSKARIKAYDELVKASNDRTPQNAQIIIPVGERLGGVVIEAEGVSKSYGDKLLIDDLSFKLPPGGIVGVIGPNGAGKTTLFRMITGQEKNDIITLGKHEMNSRAYCSTFNFKGGDQQQKVGTLSGGQRNRVHLAKMLKSGSNVILLDEPTNDLDTETLAALEDALESFAGCAVVIVV